MLSVRKVLLLFRFYTCNESSRIEHAVLQYMACTLVMDDLGKELRNVCQRWSTTGKEDHGAAAEEKMENRMGLNVCE